MVQKKFYCPQLGIELYRLEDEKQQIMQIQRVWVVILALMVGLGGCCKSVCDCITPSINITYSSNTNENIADFYHYLDIRAISDNGDTTELPFISNIFRSAVQLPASTLVTWLVINDTLNIRDTIRLGQIRYQDANDRCCDCGPYISNIEVAVNDTLYTSPTINRVY
jgi:hypothetical protein